MRGLLRSIGKPILSAADRPVNQEARRASDYPQVRADAEHDARVPEFKAKTVLECPGVRLGH
jgi:hypothetical protein